MQFILQMRGLATKHVFKANGSNFRVLKMDHVVVRMREKQNFGNGSAMRGIFFMSRKFVPMKNDVPAFVAAICYYYYFLQVYD